MAAMAIDGIPADIAMQSIAKEEKQAQAEAGKEWVDIDLPFNDFQLTWRGFVEDSERKAGDLSSAIVLSLSLVVCELLSYNANQCRSSKHYFAGIFDGRTQKR